MFGLGFDAIPSKYVSVVEWAPVLDVSNLSITGQVLLCLSSCLDSCLTPEAPQKPCVLVVSDSEVALSWKPGENEGSAPIQSYSVEFVR